MKTLATPEDATIASLPGPPFIFCVRAKTHHIGNDRPPQEKPEKLKRSRKSNFKITEIGKREKKTKNIVGIKKEDWPPVLTPRVWLGKQPPPYGPSGRRLDKRVYPNSKECK